MANESGVMQNGERAKKPTTNYFRVGLRCAFFNESDVESIRQAWEKASSWLSTSSNVRVRVWRLPLVQGPWSLECANGVIAGESLYMGRSQLGPVVS